MAQPVSNQEKKSNKKLLIGIIIGLLLLNVIGGFYLFKTNSDAKKLNAEKAELNDDYIDVVKDLEVARLSMDTLKGKNENLDKLINQRQVKIDSMSTIVKRLLRSNRVNKSELAKAQQMILQLRTDNDFFVARIDSLYKANVVLAMQRDSFQTELVAEKVVTEQLTKDKLTLTSKVQMGSLLQANNLYVTGVRERSSGKEVETMKTKRMEQIKVCFETGENRVRDIGDAVLHLRLISPQGTTLAIQSLGSGVFKDMKTGEDTQFTKELKFDYDNTNKQVCAYWAPKIFSEGTYTAEIYQDGFLLGSKKFDLK